MKDCTGYCSSGKAEAYGKITTYFLKVKPFSKVKLNFSLLVFIFLYACVMKLDSRAGEKDACL